MTDTGRQPDEAIRHEVMERLKSHTGLDATGITVEVHDGQVTLSGSVDGRWAKREAEDVAYSVAGVWDVMNRLARLDAQWTRHPTPTPWDVNVRPPYYEPGESDTPGESDAEV